MSFRVYSGPLYQRGYGLGGTFRRFFSWIVPLVKKHAIPVLESGIKHVGKTELSTAADIAHGIVAGKNFKKSAEDRIDTAVEKLKEQAEQKLEGRGINKKRKKKSHSIIFKKQDKQNITDIFS